MSTTQWISVRLSHRICRAVSKSRIRSRAFSTNLQRTIPEVCCAKQCGCTAICHQRDAQEALDLCGVVTGVGSAMQALRLRGGETSSTRSALPVAATAPQTLESTNMLKQQMDQLPLEFVIKNREFSTASATFFQ